MALLTRRGECPFYMKAQVAKQRGYCGLIVANFREGPPHRYYGRLELPDMTAEFAVSSGSSSSSAGRSGVSDSSVGLPAWLITKGLGDRLFAHLLPAGMVTMEVEEEARKLPLGSGQHEDVGGYREYSFQ